SPAGQREHRTVLTNRAINAVFSCKADAIHTGQTRLMRMQHVLPLPFGQSSDNVAALQHDFPKAAVHSGLKERNPIRTFAAPASDV
ncbi:MAG: hypothetical protein WBV62_01130, partial [Roseobacter sp.]